MQKNIGLVDSEGQKGLDLVQYEEVVIPKNFVDLFPNQSIVEKLKQIKEIKYSEGDVMLCSFPKTGTHWASNLLSLLLYDGPIEESPSIMPRCIDVFPIEHICALPSPKVVHSHLMPNRMPTDIAAKSKIVLIVRNPKDTAVSMYCHMKNAQDYEGAASWNFCQNNFLSGTVTFGPYADYLKSFEKEIKKDRTRIHVVYYEDLKQNGLEEMRKIQKYLGLNHSDERLQAIIDRCSIDKLRDDVVTGRTDAVVRDTEGKPVIYRKGEVGDWKNYFTVAESEAFDAKWERQMKDSMFHFRYA